MPFGWICIQLYCLRMMHRLIVQFQQLLCLGVKIPSRRGQHHTARHMLEQFKLQLPFQRADLLRKCRL